MHWTQGMVDRLTIVQSMYEQEKSSTLQMQTDASMLPRNWWFRGEMLLAERRKL
jgi:hypothetical protein